MSHPVAGSVLDNVFYTIGYALGEAEGRRVGNGAPRQPAEFGPEPDGEAVGAAIETTLPTSAPAVPGAALGAAVASWLLARILSPRPVRWPRAILAGVAGSALAAAAELVERRLQAIPPETPALDAPIRLAAGVAAAVAYASLLYPRLPGAPGTRGLIFGAVEAATMPAGGTFDFLRRLSPQISIPLETFVPVIVPARGPISAIAFGLGLGFYRDGAR